jgi:hypothetical protein
MKSSELFAVFTAAVLVVIILWNAIPIDTFSGLDENEAALDLNVSASRAIQTVVNDSNASAYISENFRVPEWRVVRTTLIRHSTYDLNGTAVQEGEDVWKIELMERNCACAGVNSLYVIEGYVSAETGELLDVSTKITSESGYEKATCSSTACH